MSQPERREVTNQGGNNPFFGGLPARTIMPAGTGPTVMEFSLDMIFLLISAIYFQISRVILRGSPVSLLSALALL